MNSAPEPLLSKRLLSLDCARGVASLVVVLWHWTHFFFDGYEISKDYDPTQMPFYDMMPIVFTRGGPMAVTFFFVLSGFVFFWLYKNAIGDRTCTARQFVVLRFARLYPLHLATLLLVGGLQWLYFCFHDHFFVYRYNDIFHFVANLFFLTKWGFQKGLSFNAPVWSISMEVGLYAIFFVVAYFRQATFLRSLLIVVLMVLLQHFKIGGNRPLAVEAFFAGGLTWYLVQWYSSHRHLIIDVVAVVLSGCIWGGIVSSERVAELLVGGDQLYIAIVCPIAIVGLVICEGPFYQVFRKFEWLGEITYSTYLLHFPLQLAIAIVLPFTGLSRSVFLSETSVVLFLTILLPLSYLTFHYFERPAQSWIRSRFL